MMRSERYILGIDPGSRCCGYALIQYSGSHHRAIAYGCVRNTQLTLQERLCHMHQFFKNFLCTHQPQEIAIERIFTGINPQSALKLGQAQGAILTAFSDLAIPVTFYSPREIKKSIVGFGAAEKSQIQYMVQRLFRLIEAPGSDAADALAIAWCHTCHTTSKNK